MVMLHDGLLAFFSAVGVTTVVWLLAGAVLRRLRRQLPGARILLADCGMSADARALAAYLADRTEGVALTEGPEIKLG